MIGSEEKEADVLRIFLVDDDPIALDLYCKGLMKKGYFTLKASNAADALEIIDRGLTKIDVIITDIQMPELNGFQLYQIVLKNNPKLAEKIIFITAGITDEKMEEFSLLISNPKLQKPFDIDELVQTISKISSG